MSATVTLTPFDIAARFIGTREVAGAISNPAILVMLRLDLQEAWNNADEVPWCSGFCNYVCWLLRLPRSKSLAARSWLTIGTETAITHAERGDVVVLRRSGPAAPGPFDPKAAGHVGFFAGYDETHVQVLGGNQGDSVSLARFPRDQILSIRRLV